MATHEHGTGAIVGGHCDLAIPTHYNGRRYASRMEARFAERLDLEQRAGIVRSWKPQVRLALEIPDVAGGPPITVAHYSVDFLVVYATGETHAIETKGKWTREAKLKRRIFEATWLRANPTVRYRVITKLGKFGAATEEAPPAPRPAARAPRQRSISAAEFRAMHGGK